MANQNVGPNQNPILYARSLASGQATYVTATNNRLDVNATLAVESIEIGTVDQGTGGASPWLVTGGKSNNAGAPSTTNLGVLPAIANAGAPSWSEGNQVGLSTDLAGNLRVTGSISVGGTTDNSAFTAGSSTGTTALGFYHSTIDTVTDGRAAALAIDSKRSLFTVIRDAALNARGANVNSSNQLSVSVDNTPTVTANAGTNLNTSLLATSANLTAGTQKTQIVDGSGNVIASTSNALNVNITAGSAVIGHVVTDSGSVTNATLSAETTKVIGVTRTADGTGNLLTTNSTTYTAKFGLDSNLLGTLGTAFSTAGKVDVKGADGDVFVRQTTGTNLHVVTDSTSTTAVTQATASSLNAQVVGAGAQNAAVTGNPVLEAGYASAAEPSNVGADGRAQYPWLDQKGRQIVAFQAGANANTSVAGNAGSVTLLAANTARKGATLFNDSTVTCYVLFASSGASTTAYNVQMPANSYYEVPFGYSGAIVGIWASATGSMRVNEVT